MFFDTDENITEPYLLKFWINDEIRKCCEMPKIKDKSQTSNTEQIVKKKKIIITKRRTETTK